MAEHEPDDLTPAERAALAAFAAPPPAPGLAGRVLAARDRRAARWRLLGAAVAAALLLLFAGRLLWPVPGARTGEVVATTRTVVDLGGRGVAVVEPGAALRYRVEKDGAGRVEQVRGEVAYRIRPGGPFTVATPAGEVEVVGTAFLVELTTMKKTLALAAVTTLILIVYEGRVLLQNRHGRTAVIAGERATASEAARPTLEADSAPPPQRRPAGPDRRAEMAAQAAARQRLLREIAAARSGRQAGPAAQPQPQGPGPGTLDKDYIRTQVREIIPLIQECYQDALEKAPRLGGRIVMKFTISGEPDIGGLVETAEVEEASEGLKDASLQECMRESMYALRFKPPKGGGQVEVSYPFVLRSSDDEAPPSETQAPPARPPARP